MVDKDLRSTVELALNALSSSRVMVTGLGLRLLKRDLPLMNGVRRIRGSWPPSNQMGSLFRDF